MSCFFQLQPMSLLPAAKDCRTFSFLAVMTKNQTAARISAAQGQVMWAAGASCSIQRPAPGGRRGKGLPPGALASRAGKRQFFGRGLAQDRRQCRPDAVVHAAGARDRGRSRHGAFFTQKEGQHTVSFCLTEVRLRNFPRPHFFWFRTSPGSNAARKQTAGKPFAFQRPKCYDRGK